MDVRKCLVIENETIIAVIIIVIIITVTIRAINFKFELSEFIKFMQGLAAIRAIIVGSFQLKDMVGEFLQPQKERHIIELPNCVIICCCLH